MVAFLLCLETFYDIMIKIILTTKELKASTDETKF